MTRVVAGELDVVSKVVSARRKGVRELETSRLDGQETQFRGSNRSA